MAALLKKCDAFPKAVSLQAAGRRVLGPRNGACTQAATTTHTLSTTSAHAQRPCLKLSFALAH